MRNSANTPFTTKRFTDGYVETMLELAEPVLEIESGEEFRATETAIDGGDLETIEMECWEFCEKHSGITAPWWEEAAWMLATWRARRVKPPCSSWDDTERRRQGRLFKVIKEYSQARLDWGAEGTLRYMKG